MSVFFTVFRKPVLPSELGSAGDALKGFFTRMGQHMGSKVVGLCETFRTEETDVA